MLAHINPQEAALLKSMGGAGTVNPQTGLPEFYGMMGGFSSFPQREPDPLPSLGQALSPEAAQAASQLLTKITVPEERRGMAGTVAAYEKVNPEFDQYANKEYRGMGGVNVAGYTVPTDQTFQGKPLVAKYDPKGNFLHMTMEGDNFLTPDVNQPNIIAQPKINAKGEMIDYGVYDVNQQDDGGFGSFLGGLVSDFGPMILAGLGANFAAGNLGNFFGGGAAAGGATAADIAASNALAGANLAGYAGTDLAATAAGTGLGANLGTNLGTGLGTGLGASSGTGLTALPGAGLDLAATTGGGLGLTATPGTGLGLAAATGGGLGLTGGSAGAGAIGAGIGDTLAGINTGIGAGLGSALGAGAAAAGGSGLSSLLPKTPAELAALVSGAGNVASGVIGASAAEKAAQIQADAAIKAAQIQQEMFNTINAQGAPYRASGYNALNQIGSMLPGQYSKYDASGKLTGTDTGTGYFTQQYGPEQFQKDIDPGYAFRLQQGQMANERASNLAGGLIGGNALRGMQDYTQGMASQEYGNAFNRFQTQRGNIYNTLAGIAGIGQTAQGQANTLAQNNATAQGQLGVGAAAAQAAGQIGQATGYGGALTGAGNAYLLSKLLGQNQGVAGNSSGSNFMNSYNAIG